MFEEKSHLPPVSKLNRLFSYNHETGKLTRKTKTSNRNRIGDLVGNDNGQGYLKTRIGECNIFVHRAIWAIVHNQWPTERIDHVNGDRTDNRMSNLRLASAAENSWNRKRRSENSTGFKGVHFHKPSGKWQARIDKHGVSKSLGLHTSPQAAAEAYKEAAEMLHGEFARL